MNSTTVTVVGLCLTGFCVLIAARPVWFRSWRVHHRDSDGRSRGSTRLGDGPSGAVSAFYGVLAAVFLVATLVIRGWAVEDARCDRAEAVHQAGSDETSWEAAAGAEGWVLESERQSTSSGDTRWTSFTLSNDSGRLVATWSQGTGFGDRFQCQR